MGFFPWALSGQTRVIGNFRPTEKEGSHSASECKKRADDLDKAEAWNIYFLTQSRKDYLESDALCNFKIVQDARKCLGDLD